MCQIWEITNIKWLFKNEFAYDVEVFENACLNENLENIKLLLENEFLYNEKTFACAAENGN